MNWNFSLENFNTVWGQLIQIGIVLIFLFLGNFLRNIIPFLKRGLIPSALIGGTLLLVFNIILKNLFNFELVSKNFMQIITYHGLGIGFIAMTLKINKEKKNISLIKSVENGALTGATYMLQAFVGIAITVIFFIITKTTNNVIWADSGVLLPLAFGQGPGNALTWDINFSNLLDDSGNNLFTGNGSFGLTLASIGFIVASLFGILYINYFKKRGLIQIRKHNDNLKLQSLELYDDEIPDSESVDKFSIQLGIVFICYVATFGIMSLLGSISDFTNSIAWGFNFIWGVLCANIFKLIHKFLRKKKILKRTYINNYQMDRISGFAFDLMIVAGVASIEINDVKRYIIPLIVLCAIGTLVTFIYVRFVTKRKFKGYEHEMFVINFGTLTGTASNGMILVKEIDPNYETPAANIFVVSQVPAMLFVAPLLLLLSFSSKSLLSTLICMGIFILLFIIYNLFIFRDVIFKKKNHWFSQWF